MRKLSSSKDSSNMETRFLASSIRNLLPRSMSSSSSSFSKLKTNSNPKNPKSNIENTPPIDPNIQIDHGQTNSPLLAKQLPSDLHKSKPEIAGSYADQQETVPSDAPVKVVVRIKPANDGARDGDGTIKKVSSDSVSVGDRRFTFDSVFDSKANQGDVFQLVGVPLVKNALAGYNTSIVSYGQSGSGKTYTMWGPPSAMVEDPSPHSQQGIVPRTFQMLFSEIDKERQNSEGKQINYQCRCSFLEIYNEQIGDLLDPTQRRLEIKDDPKNGLFVENLTEEYVTSYEDVIQILIKGLSSRKVGATSVNSKSSRSHIVFTFFIESWCKETSSKCFGSSKTSRISLVDLAGLDKNKIDDDAGRQCAREGKNVKKSLLRLGQLVNTLATKGPESGKSEDSLYKGSCLTQLLRESLGGNSKLTVICAISPDKNNNSEILRTLRFGERVKSVRNEPVVNEITEDDVNDLSDQIRQLKEELIRAKSTASNSVGGKYGHFQGWNVRESLNQLRVSLNRSLILPRIDHDSDEEVNVDEDDVNELRKQLDELRDSHEENSGDLSLNRLSIQVGESCETDLMSQDDINYPEETECEEINLETSENEIPHKENITLTENLGSSSKTLEAKNPGFRSSISISSCRPSILQEPTLSESPKIGKNHRKSVTISSSHSVSRNNVSDSSKINSDVLRQSLSQSENIRSSLQSSKIFPGPTESLAASLQRGLQIIDYHQRNSASNGTPVAFSFEHLTLKPCPEVDNTNASTTLLCASCRKQIQETDSNEVQDSLKTWIVAVDGAGKPMTDEATKDARNAMAEVTKREELENRCMEQAAKIEQLNQLIEQYKCEKHNSIVEDGQESNSRCLLSSKNEIIPFEESKDVDIHFLKDETKHFRCNSLDKHPEVIKENYEIKEVQNESVLGYGNNISFDANEKEELLKEIQLLRSKLKSQTDASPNKSTEKLRSSLLSRSIQLRKSGAYQNFSQEELERERERWTEMESDWISLTDELRIDLDAHRRRAEKVEMELKLEKQCTEELDDALQRSVLGHARFVEHYAELQEKYNDLAGKHRAIMEGIAEVKKAMAKAGKKGHGPRFAKSLAAELSAMRVERERERELLKKENKSLRIQLRDTAEAVHAAGELLVRLRETEHAASVAEENFTNMQQENEKLKKQMEKLKRKHKMELVTMKQYLAESKLPESALQPLYHEDSNIAQNTIPDDDQAWRAEFGAIYQDHY
ncbi:kinesin-like protein KIN-12F [Ziziphus jujuba]|uniref:Kinesin-like protein KIN-12F n=1 Tax=Ziziphus jujuba TaxID=326968 RepID=A0A6P3YT00_ZIZJJ|nr:kinesin-like protein KIN-12F [Ziziphus jujuba]